MAEQEELTQDICNDVLGLGPLEPLLARDDIADIMVNGATRTYIEVGGKIQLTSIRFRDNAQLMNICQRIVSQVGRRVDESSPICDARLLDGSAGVGAAGRGDTTGRGAGAITAPRGGIGARRVGRGDGAGRTGSATTGSAATVSGGGAIGGGVTAAGRATVVGGATAGSVRGRVATGVGVSSVRR
jgi:hypothetical protein